MDTGNELSGEGARDSMDLRWVGENHRRGIRTTLLLVDELLCHVRDWAEGRCVQSSLIDGCNTLTLQQRARLAAVAGELEGLIARAAEDLGLEREPRDAAQAIWSECLSLRVGLTELGSRYLERYGPVPRELAEYADALVLALLEGLNRLSNIAIDGSAQ